MILQVITDQDEQGKDASFFAINFPDLDFKVGDFLELEGVLNLFVPGTLYFPDESSDYLAVEAMGTTDFKVIRRTHFFKDGKPVLMLDLIGV